jgi:hypothetical protein
MVRIRMMTPSVDARFVVTGLSRPRPASPARAVAAAAAGYANSESKCFSAAIRLNLAELDGQIAQQSGGSRHAVRETGDGR